MSTGQSVTLMQNFFYRKTSDGGEMEGNETEKEIKALREKLSKLSSRSLVFMVLISLLVFVFITEYLSSQQMI